MYRASIKNESPKEQLQAAKDSVAESGKGIKDDVVAAVSKA
jgi:hypothetical protein